MGNSFIDTSTASNVDELTSIATLRAYYVKAGFKNYLKIDIQNQVHVAKFWHVAYVGKYQKVYIRNYTFYLLIFLTIFAKLVLIYVEWKIANLAKTYIEVPFQKKFML